MLVKRKKPDLIVYETRLFFVKYIFLLDYTVKWIIILYRLREKQQPSKDANMKTSEKITCEICGKEIKKQINFYNLFGQKACSDECMIALSNQKNNNEKVQFSDGHILRKDGCCVSTTMYAKCCQCGHQIDLTDTDPANAYCTKCGSNDFEPRIK